MELCAENRAPGGGVAGHRWDLFKLKAGDKHWCWSDPAPAVEFPAGTQEFEFGAQGDVENHFRGAGIKLLREFQEGAFAEVLAVGGAPDGDVEGFLLNLVGDGERAEEGAGNGFGDVEGRANAVGFEAGGGGDEREFEGHVGSLPVSARV